MKTVLLLPVCFCCLFGFFFAHAQKVETLFWNHSSGGATHFTNSFEIRTNTYVQVLSYLNNIDNSTEVTITTTNGAVPGLLKEGLVLAGPATVTFTNRIATGPWSGFITYSVCDNQVQQTPTASVVIPADSVGPVEIVLESSVDMVNWTAALPGVYGASTTNRFFRVRSIRH